MFASVEDILQELSRLKYELLPESEIEIVYKRIDRVSIRVVLSPILFIDIYANVKNGRYDFCLMKDNKRIFGCDNLGGWHRHTLNSPDKHIECKEPSSTEQILKEITVIIHTLRK